MTHTDKKLEAFRNARKSTPTKSNVSLITSVVDGPDTLNADGFPAFSDRSLEASAARVVLCGILKDQFYTPKELQAGEAVAVLRQVAASNPTYLLKLAKLARQNNLKFMVKMIVAALSPHTDFTKRHEDTIVELLATFHPGQLLEYVELQKSKAFGHGLGSRQQRWVRKVIEGWDERTTVYYSLKYRRALNVLLRLAHPKPGKFRDYVLDVDVSSLELHPRQSALESIKSSKDVTKIAETMIQNDIPWDVVKGFAPSKPHMWFAYMQQSGTSAILLNTRNYINHKVFELDGAYDEFKRLLNKDRVSKARLLPLDVAKTFQAIRGKDSTIENHLTKVFAQSFLTPIQGLADKKVAVSIDCSASMSGDQLLRAGTVAASFVDQAAETWITGFSTELYEEGETKSGGWYGRTFPQLSGLPKEQMVKNLFDLTTLGGTNTELAVQKALDNSREFDFFVIITDEQQNTGRGLYKVFQDYRKKVNKDAVLFIVNVTNYPWRNAQGENVVLFNTVTPALFRAIEYAGQDLISVVNNVQL